MSTYVQSRRRSTAARRQLVSARRRRGIPKIVLVRQPRSRLNVRTGGYMGLEMKFADIETDQDAFATTWAAMEDATNDSVSGVAQGDGESQRDGRKYWIHSIHIRCTVEATAIEAQTAPLADLKGRICLVWDTQTNGAQLVATDVFDGGLTDDTLAFRNLQHVKRFRILWDKKFRLVRNNVAQGGIDLFATNRAVTSIMVYDKNFAKPIPVICQATTAVIAAISDNSLHIIGVANSTSALLNMQIRIRFTG